VVAVSLLASGQSLSNALLPRWAVDGGWPELLKRLDDSATLAKIQVEMRDNLRRRGGPESLLLIVQGQPWTGKRLAEVATEWQVEPIEAALRIIRTGQHLDATASFNMIEDDLRAIMRQPWVVTSSDGADGHPRGHASFPLKYAKYVRAEHVLSLERFIRNSTGRSADIFKLERRGYLKAGYFADVLVFDPARFAPKADYLHPNVLSAGVDQLLVNGTAVIRDGKLTGAAPGKVLLRSPPPGTCP